MYLLTHQIAFYTHVLLGSVALIVFWLPIISKKGSPMHRKIGNIFTNLMYAVSISGMFMAVLVLADPLAIRVPDGGISEAKAISVAYNSRVVSSFLFMLSILVFCSTRHAVNVLQVKADRDRLKTLAYLSPIALLAILGVLMGLLGFKEDILLFQIFAGLSVLVSVGMFRYIFKKQIKQREWIIEHLGSILGSGIGAYTAFFAFGGRRFLSAIFEGDLQMIPWILPSVLGISASIYFSRKYRKQFRVE